MINFYPLSFTSTTLNIIHIKIILVVFLYKGSNFLKYGVLSSMAITKSNWKSSIFFSFLS